MARSEIDANGPQTSSKLVVLVLSVLATIAALVSIIMPAVINNAAPGTDSMQTWTCEWGSTKGAPSNFKALCHENVRLPTLGEPYMILILTQTLTSALPTSLVSLSLWHSYYSSDSLCKTCSHAVSSSSTAKWKRRKARSWIRWLQCARSPEMDWKARIVEKRA